MAEDRAQILDDYLVEDLNFHMGYYFRASKRLFAKKTPYQNLEVLEIPEFGRVLRLDGIFQTSERDEHLYHEPLAHVPGITMNGPKSALVIGGGDGGSAEELLKYKTMERVVMIELDKDVCDASLEYIPSISNGAFSDKRLNLRFEDGIKYIQNSKEKFDQVIVDLTDPFGPSLALYTREFYQNVADILTENGAFTLHIESPIVSTNAFARLHKTLKSVFKHVRPMLNYVPMYGTLWGYAMASQTLDPLTLTKKDVSDRIASLGLKNLQFYNEDTHFSLLAMPNYIRDLLAKDVPIATSENLIKIEKSSQDNFRLAQV